MTRRSEAQQHVLVIAGLDPSGGAGLLADARVVADHGLRAVGVVTALTVQDTVGVRSAHPVDPDVIAEQLAALLADVEVDAVKIGMLGTHAAAVAVARALAATRARVVWDPVLFPSRGGVALFEGDLRAAVDALIGEVSLVTPNLGEARVLTGSDDPRAAADRLRLMGAHAVLIKGGHAEGEQAIDLLSHGAEVREFGAPRLDVGPTHGTGCVLSTAIACRLALGDELPAAVGAAKEYVTSRLRQAFQPGRGARCLV